MASFYNLTIGQQTEFNRILSNAGFSAELVNGVIQNPSLADKMLDALTLNQDKFAQYAHLLRSLDQQVIELRRLNKKMPKDMRVPNSWFNNLERNYGHIQSIERLKFYYVVKDTLEATLAYNWKLIELTQSAVYHAGFETSMDKLRLDQSAYNYNVGIHLVEINLTANSSLKEGKSIPYVRELAKANNKTLAGVEAIAAYALHPRLLQLQDNKKIPSCNLAGLQQGRDFDQTVLFFWDPDSRKVCMISWNPNYANRFYAAPSIKKC